MATESLAGEVKRHSTWTIIMGIVIVLLGIVLVAHPFAAALTMTVLLGWVLAVVGIAQFVFALHSGSAGKFFLKALSALLFVVAGLGLAFFPASGLATLTALLGVFLVVEAGVLIVTAFHMRPLKGWGWFLFDGLASLVLGILILAHWPSSSVWAIGTLVGFAVLLSGFARIMIAGRIRSGATAADKYIRGNA
ncbi:MAG: HdeD family acid-resistance protein [Terracidiphilus sp.]